MQELTVESVTNLNENVEGQNPGRSAALKQELDVPLESTSSTTVIPISENSDLINFSKVCFFATKNIKNSVKK